MNITLDLIKKVREATGAGVSDVKEALGKTSGNEQQAIEYLRKQGQKIAAQKKERSTTEGIIALEKKDDKIAIILLSCETDFVARNEDFISAAQAMASRLLAAGKEAFTSWADNKIKNDLIVKIGENIQLTAYEIITGQTLGYYLHANKKIAAIVELDNGPEKLAKEIAMQVAAMNPKYLKPEDIPAEVMAKEKEIYREQLLKESKPAEMVEKILTGKLQKFYAEVCLTKQLFIKDDKITVEKLLGNAEIKAFYRFSL